MSETVRVVVGIIPHNDTILLCQRKPVARYGLKWEFPGGKMLEDETPEDALARELNEELGISIRAVHPVFQTTNRYDDGGRFAVTYFVVDGYAGKVVNYEFHNLAWVRVEDLLKYDILEGNREIVHQMIQGTIPLAPNTN